MRLIVLISCIIFTSLLQKALGQDNAAIYKKGFLFGLSTGAGSIHTSISNAPNEAQAGVAHNWKIGTMLTSRTALLLQGVVTTYRYSGNAASPRERLRGFEGLLPSLQYWVNNRLWITGGVGVGMDNPVFYDVKDSSEGRYHSRGFKTALNTGYEIWQRKNMTIDIQGRLSHGAVQVPEGTRNSLAADILIGFNLY
ncbi:hypothetical protein [Telluribacter sp. SYSU D00476]|uniref:hypothetical protein n=1 Tax=Telluribacter sp. SYSU D00476 TaxID=2811430 RepID=UPI001FF29BC3|nr:hypothetical protein [Telluribacter sp. SYSU D00476]